MKTLHLGFALLLLGACTATPLGAQRDAQRAYEECVELNGEARCERERALAEKRQRELNERDLNRGVRSRERY